MKMTDALEARRSQAEDALKDVTSKALAAGAAAKQMRLRALDLTSRATTRARDEVDRRRSSAAMTLEGLAEAIRPSSDPALARRRSLAVTGSGLALTSALSLGVVLGFVLSRQLKKRSAKRITVATPAAQISSSAQPSISRRSNASPGGGSAADLSESSPPPL